VIDPAEKTSKPLCLEDILHLETHEPFSVSIFSSSRKWKITMVLYCVVHHNSETTLIKIKQINILPIIPPSLARRFKSWKNLFRLEKLI